MSKKKNKKLILHIPRRATFSSSSTQSVGKSLLVPLLETCPFSYTNIFVTKVVLLYLTRQGFISVGLFIIFIYSDLYVFKQVSQYVCEWLKVWFSLHFAYKITHAYVRILLNSSRIIRASLSLSVRLLSIFGYFYLFPHSEGYDL